LIAANQSAKDILGIPKSEDVNLNLFNNPNIASKKKKLIDKGKIKVSSKINFKNLRKEGYYNPTRPGTVYLDFFISIIDLVFI
jgi:hypothetical protein